MGQQRKYSDMESAERHADYLAKSFMQGRKGVRHITLALFLSRIIVDVEAQSLAVGYAKAKKKEVGCGNDANQT